MTYLYVHARGRLILNMEEKCIACACDIKRGVSIRRKLYSSSTRHVLPTIKAMFGDLYNSDDSEKLLPSLESNVCKENIFICIKCFRSLEKLLKLQTEKNQVEKSLKAGLIKVGQHAQLQLTRSEVTHTPTRVGTRKRSRESSPPSSRPSKKRRGPDTPTRGIIRRIHAPGTPTVSVSSQENYLETSCLYKFPSMTIS